MDVTYDAMSRRDVVIIFVDMDSSIYRTDLALPRPLGEPVCLSSGNTNAVHISSSSSNNYNNTNNRITPQQTRLDVIRQALSSFVIQKLRASPNAMVTPLISIYAVQDDVVELLEPTCGNIMLIESVIRGQLTGTGKSREMSTKSSPFPFRAVFDVLQRTVEQFTEFEKKRNSSGGDDISRGTSNVSMFESPNNTNLSKQQSINHRSLTPVQGILLLNRDGALRHLQYPTNTIDSEPLLGTGPIVQSHLDIIPLNSPSQEEAASFARKAEDLCGLTNIQGSSTSTTTTAMMMMMNPFSDSITIDGSYSMIDLLGFTGLTHRGLALGCALTKLLTPHPLRSRDFFSRPIQKVRLPRPTGIPQTSVMSLLTQQQQSSITSNPSRLSRGDGEYQQQGYVVSENPATEILTGEPVGRGVGEEKRRFSTELQPFRQHQQQQHQQQQGTTPSKQQPSSLSSWHQQQQQLQLQQTLIQAQVEGERQRVKHILPETSKAGILTGEPVRPNAGNEKRSFPTVPDQALRYHHQQHQATTPPKQRSSSLLSRHQQKQEKTLISPQAEVERQRVKHILSETSKAEILSGRSLTENMKPEGTKAFFEKLQHIPTTTKTSTRTATAGSALMEGGGGGEVRGREKPTPSQRRSSRESRTGSANFSSTAPFSQGDVKNITRLDRTGVNPYTSPSSGNVGDCNPARFPPHLSEGNTHNVIQPDAKRNRYQGDKSYHH